MYKILIVEDDETIRNGIKTLLELQGYYVDIAVNGVDGLKKFDETYSLVIMDIIMAVVIRYRCLQKNEGRIKCPNFISYCKIIRNRYNARL